MCFLDVLFPEKLFTIYEKNLTILSCFVLPLSYFSFAEQSFLHSIGFIMLNINIYYIMSMAIMFFKLAPLAGLPK